MCSPPDLLGRDVPVLHYTRCRPFTEPLCSIAPLGLGYFARPSSAEAVRFVSGSREKRGDAESATGYTNHHDNGGFTRTGASSGGTRGRSRTRKAFDSGEG